MSERITISVPEMEAAIAKYNSVKANKLAAVEAMNAAVKTLDGSYDGPAATIFMAAFDRLYANLKNSEQIMESSMDALKNTLAALDQADPETNAKLFQALDEGPKPVL